MELWEHLKKRIKYIEISILLVTFFALLFGVICDYLVTRGVIFVIVQDISDLSLALLQIQAAVTTLTLSILALLSGNMLWSIEIVTARPNKI